MLTPVYQVLENQPGLVDIEQRANETPKMWHVMDELREDGNWTLCGIWLDPSLTQRENDVETDCIVCDDLWDWREQHGL